MLTEDVNAINRRIQQSAEFAWHRIHNLELIVDELTRQLRLADQRNEAIKALYDKSLIKLEILKY